MILRTRANGNEPRKLGPAAQRHFARSHQNFGISQGNLNVLELGSGPGFLAEFLLDELPIITIDLTLLDFSPAMHDLARIRLGERADHVRFLERSFKDLDWNHDLGPFDAVIINQAVHELRHKRYATALHMQVRRALKPNAPYLVSDHYFGEGGMTDDRLFMTVDEQRESLEAAGFTAVDRVMQAGSLVMHRAASQLAIWTSPIVKRSVSSVHDAAPVACSSV